MSHLSLVWDVPSRPANALTLFWALVCPTDITVQLRIEDATRKLRSGELGIPPNPEDRFDQTIATEG